MVNPTATKLTFNYKFGTIYKNQTLSLLKPGSVCCGSYVHFPLCDLTRKALPGLRE